MKEIGRVFMSQLETKLFASSYIWLAYIFDASYSTAVTSVRKKSSVDQSELEKKVVSHCQTYVGEDGFIYIPVYRYNIETKSSLFLVLLFIIIEPCFTCTMNQRN